MLQAIEVIVKPGGNIRPLEEFHVTTPTKAVLTLLEAIKPLEEEPEQGDGKAVLALLQTSRFANRPQTDTGEVEQRIHTLRNDWNNE